MFNNRMYGWFYSPDKGDGDGSNGSSAETEKPDTSHMIPKERFDEINNRSKELEKELAAAQEALKKAQTKSLEEKEQYKELYEKTAGELSEVKPIAEQVATYKETMQKLLEAQIADIPEDLRGIIPDETEMSVVQRLNWIAKNKAILTKSIAPDLGAGKRGATGQATPELSPEEKKVAKAFGLSEEDYIKYMDKKNNEA